MKEYGHLLQLFLTHLKHYQAGLAKKSPKELYEPGNYILSLGGKRLRPLLALVACDLFDKRPQLALDSALAVELFHNFSLIHDDILDDAPLRRGKPTLHLKWDVNTGILSGDVMLVEANRALENYQGKAYRELTVLFNHTASLVCEGQQMDMNFEKLKRVTTAEYIHMISLKTAVLLGCSLQMGAICAGAGQSAQQKLYQFGNDLGIAFQLLDDYLDAFAPSSLAFGKQAGGDILANKKTFLLVKALEMAKPAQKKQIDELLALPADQARKKVDGMLNLYSGLNVDKLCISAAQAYTESAIGALNQLKVNAPKKAALKNLAMQLTRRQS